MVQVLNERYNYSIRAIKAKDQYIYINGRKCIDFCLGAGTHILGHGFFNNKEFMRHVDKGTLYTVPNFLASEYARLFSKFCPLDSMVFANTGTEAVMRAFRIARAYTGRKKIAIFHGSWHGSQDSTLWHSHPKGTVKEHVVLLPDDNTCFEKIHRNPDIAMVFLEPFQGSNPQDNGIIINRLPKFCESKGILIGFDEIISGFRYPGIDHYAIKPDLATYGKIAGGGFPIGIVAGKKKVMEVVQDGVFMGGTFSANPISLWAGIQMMRQLGPSTIRSLNTACEEMKASLNKYCEKLSVIGEGSIMRLMFTNKKVLNCAHRDKLEMDRKVKLKVYQNLLFKGIHIGSNGLIFLCSKHTKSDLDHLKSSILQEDFSLRSQDAKTS